MSADPRVSHVAFPRRRDTRQTPELEAIGATPHATSDATTPRKPASLRDLARDTLMRHQCDKTVARLATSPCEVVATVASVAPVASVAAVSVRKGGNPLMTAKQGDACHAPSWNDAEIQAFADRRDRLLRWGYAEQDADDLAERLTLRDREADDRRVCAECHHGRARCCPDGAPLPRDVLHRCGAFSEHAQ